ncbi:MAG TPA: thioredoxin domain-containing protein [Candidatus Limnocylindrales bacterium]|jgi:protein-disulfide isomerase|nr:thioredoxin domain-containing protein [Candidatus Limnocylindrales bacterium]
MKQIAGAAFALIMFFALGRPALAADGSKLTLPSGVKVAVVVFEDLECPDCARAYPVVWEAANAHKVPVELHDFPLSMHPWSFKAAVNARYFDTKSTKIGDDYRGFIYKNQPQITAGNLQAYTQKFADDNKVPLPFAIDPEGKLTQLVRSDYDLGTQCSLQHTPTIFVVGQGKNGIQWEEVNDRALLPQMIEDMQKKVAAAAPAAKPAAQRAHKKKS